MTPATRLKRQLTVHWPAFVLILISAVSSSAVTTILVSQIRGDVSTATGSIVATLPNTSTSAWLKIGTNLSVSNGALNAAGGSSTPMPTPMAEVPSGTINGTNPTFTLSFAPLNNTQMIFLNGVYISPSQGDYTISGSTVTMTGKIPQTGDSLVAQYWH